MQNHSVGRAVFPQKPLGEDLSLPLPAPGGSQQSLAYRCITPISASVSPWPLEPKTQVFGSVALYPNFPLLLRTTVTLDVGPTLIEFDLILT